MDWGRFEASAPDLALLARRLVEGPGVCLVATLRRDGWPRISPCEPYLVDNELLLGMMHRSAKAADLLRDPRVTIHNAHADRTGDVGDVKVYGRVRDLSGDAAWVARYGDATQARIDWRPAGAFHLFAVDVVRVGFIRFGDERSALRWTERDGVEPVPHPDV